MGDSSSQIQPDEPGTSDNSSGAQANSRVKRYNTTKNLQRGVHKTFYIENSILSYLM